MLENACNLLEQLQALAIFRNSTREGNRAEKTGRYEGGVAGHAIASKLRSGGAGFSIKAQQLELVS